MKKTNELSLRQMKDVKGGNFNQMCSVGKKETVGDGGHCFIDGETVFECMCTSDKQCQNVYGSSAICWV